MKRLLVLSFLTVLSLQVSAQQFWDMMNDPTVKVSDTYDAYMQYVDGRDPHDVPGSKQFYRWYEQAVKFAYPNETLEEFTESAHEVMISRLQNNTFSAQQKVGGTWQSFGPQTAPINGYTGKTDAIAFHPTDPNIIFVGGAMGLWRTTDGGNSWTPFTDDLPLSGVYGIAISESNPDVVYFVNGTYGGYSASALGVFKSTDGGNSWTLTNFNFQTVGAAYGKDILVDPTDENIVYVGTTNGLYKSVDGMNTFNQINTTSVRELHFNPQNPNKIYLCSNSVQYSEDGGNTWQNQTGIPGGSSLTMTVTNADTNIVYASKTSLFGGFEALYKSTDGGANFTLQSDSPNIYGGSLTGIGSGGQGSYCIGIACSNTDPNKLFCGGIHLWTSDDGGVTWYTDTNIAGTHADVQILKFHNGDFWMGNDGGLFKTNDNGTTWTNYPNIQSSLIYNIGLSELNPGTFLTGWQDNGSAYQTNGIWEKVACCDGFECFIDYTDTNVRVVTWQNGNVLKTEDGQNYNYILSANGSGANGQGIFATHIHHNRTKKNQYLIGKDKMYYSNDRGNTWGAMNTIPYNTFWNKVSTFDVCQKNDNYIYVESVGEAFRSEDNGQTWVNITAGTDPDSAYISKIVVSPTDSLHIWLSKNGTNATSKVYESTDGGDNWTNISSGLPNLPVTSLTVQKGAASRVYACTVAGIYERDENSSSWELFGTGLPNVRATETEIDYENGTIYASTYGRGVWTNQIILDSIAPTADFRAYPQEVCGLGTGEVIFLDLSQQTPTSWEWNFPGGSPSTSSQPSPFVTYPATGTYTAELITTNPWGTDTITRSVYVENIALPPSMPGNSIEGFENSNNIPSYMTIENPDLDNTWEIDTTAGGYDNSEHSIMIENFNNGSAGNHDEFIMEYYDMTDAEFINLTFDVANKSFDASAIDSLAIYVSNDCSQNWTLFFNKNGNDLYNQNQFETNNFVPQQDDWKTFTADLSNYSGSHHFSLKFVNRSGGGNNMYIDNINIVATSTDPPVANYNSSSTEICEGDSIYFSDQSSQYPNSWNWAFSGGTPAVSNNPNEWVTYTADGNYDVQLISSNLNGTDTLINTQYVTVNANPSTPVITQNGGDLTTATGYNYTWFWDGSPLNGSNNTINVNQSGYYQVLVEDNNGCTALSDSLHVYFAGIPTYENGFNIYPNPADQKVVLISKEGIQEAQVISLTDITGKQVLPNRLLNPGEKIEMSTANLANGVYFINSISSISNQRRTYKIVIHHQ